MLPVPASSPTPPSTLQRTPSQVTRNRHTGSRFNPFEERTNTACDITLKLLSGTSQVDKLNDMLKTATIKKICRGSVGPKYIQDLLKKKKESAFAVVATNEKGQIVGFTRNLVYSAYAGGNNSNARIRDPVPIKQRIVMLDLVCTDPACSGLGKIMLRSLIDTSRDVFGATLLMLEATAEASGFYAKFGFRRVPNACDWSEDAIKEAQAAFRARDWDPRETQPIRNSLPNGTVRTIPSYRNAAAVDSKLGGVWWRYYNRPPNGTVVMSLCLGRPREGIKQFAAAWTSPQAVSGNTSVPASASSTNHRMNAAKYLVNNWRARMQAAKAARQAAEAEAARRGRVTRAGGARRPAA